MQAKTLGALVALTLAGSAQAAELITTLSYATLGRAHSSWLVDAAAEDLDREIAQVEVGDLPPIDFGHGHHGYHSTYLGGRAYANLDGVIYSGASMAAGGQMRTSAQWTESFRNETGAAQNYRMDFSTGTVSAYLGGWSADHEQRDFSVSFSYVVQLNGNAIWSTQQTLSLINGVFSLSRSGADIGVGALVPGEEPSMASQYTLGAQAQWLDLGPIGADQGFELSYSLTTELNWIDPMGCPYECAAVSLSVGGSESSGVTVAISAVPEPQPAALLAAGLGLFAWLARRQQRR